MVENGENPPETDDLNFRFTAESMERWLETTRHGFSPPVGDYTQLFESGRRQVSGDSSEESRRQDRETLDRVMEDRLQVRSLDEITEFPRLQRIRHPRLSRNPCVCKDENLIRNDCSFHNGGGDNG